MKEPVCAEQGGERKRGRNVFASVLRKRQMPVKMRNKSLFALMQLMGTRNFPATFYPSVSEFCLYQFI